MCVLSVLERLNAFPQAAHLCGFSFVWMILWRQSVDAWRNPACGGNTCSHTERIVIVSQAINIHIAAPRAGLLLKSVSVASTQ